MLVFAASDKGGTGRSVTSCNIAYHLAQRYDVAYLDFDFGSPTAGAIFEMARVERGVDQNGLHSYIEGEAADPYVVDVWQNTARDDLRSANARAGRLVLLPGNRGGAEFPCHARHVNNCVTLFSRLDREFDICVVDLSAGRSHAVSMVLEATAREELSAITARWLIFHRWTRQHVMAAAALVNDTRGIIEVGKAAGHDPDALDDAIRYVRTAVPRLNSPLATSSPPQAAWLHAFDEELNRLAREKKLGRSRMLGITPMEPVLQWREQVITHADVDAKIANAATAESFRELATKLTDDTEWEGL
ncbi:SCO2523 family variant P-loop protein [Actinophytocola sp.]|uniref:SCO2523 family variant P-loop protein n=1 Tax=Actinophytocola sp. TaxID=1872138 RepID=UPI002D7EDF70|nr:SCO2523 family variant P-loop protein [Actinophytocola sp.]HET9140218.1 SCO2523 family variant P-loop protein [Actinophytocola sp.]